MAQKRIDEKEKKDQRLKEDIASFKASVVFLLLCAVIFFTLNNLANAPGTLYLPFGRLVGRWWFVGIFVLLFIGAAVWYIRNVRAHKDESCRYFSSADALGLALFLLVYVLTFRYTWHAHRLIAVTLALALIYYVKHFFGKDFLLITLLNLDIALGLWLVFGNTGISALGAKIGAAVICAAGFLLILFFLCRMMADKKKMKQNRWVLWPAIVSIALGAVLAVLLWFVPAFSVSIAGIILLVQYVGLGVYYTVRLLNQ